MFHGAGSHGAIRQVQGRDGVLAMMLGVKGVLILRSTRGLALLFIMSLCSACVPLQPKATADTLEADDPSTLEEKPSVAIYLVKHRWHTGLIVPHRPLPGIQRLQDYLGKAEYYEFAWGDNRFYRADNGSILLMLRALFWPTSSVMHVVAFDRQPPDYFRGQDIVKLPVTEPQLQLLIERMMMDFSNNEENELKVLERGLYGNSRFFAADESYTVFYNCNDWTVQALQSAGFNINAPWIATSGEIMKRAQTLQESQPVTTTK